MDLDRPAADEALNLAGEPAVPRPAATIVLLRGGDRALEVLLVRRTDRARFMAGVWVFPGGAVDAAEGEGDAAQRRAAVRELREEAGIALDDPDALVRFSRWITPPEIAIRFDTHFFLAELTEPQPVRVDGDEIVDHRWTTPADALRACEADEIALVFPTIRTLQQLAGFGSVTELLRRARGRDVRPVVPHVVTDGEVARIVLRDDDAEG